MNYCFFAFNLTASLAKLAGDQAALKTFLTGLDLDGNGKADNADAKDPAAANDLALDDALTAAWGAADKAITGDYLKTNTAAVNAGLVSVQEATNAAALSVANETLTTATKAVAAVTGLQSAITAYDAAVAAEEVTLAAKEKAGIAFVSAVKTYNVDATTDANISASNADGTDLAIASGDDVYAVAGGKLVDLDWTAMTAKLVDGVTETTNPGITAVLNAANAFLTAAKAEDTATTAIGTKAAALLALDPTWGDDAVAAAALATAKTDLADLYAAAVTAAQDEANTFAAADGGTAGAVTLTKFAGLITQYTYTQTGGGTAGPKTVLAADTNIDNAHNTFFSGAYTDAVNADIAAGLTTSKYEALHAAQTDVKDAQATIDALTKALATLSADQALDAQRTTLEKAITNADSTGSADALHDAGWNAAALGGAVDANGDGYANDAFLFNAADATITNFDAVGNDLISFAAGKYTVTTVKAADWGVKAVGSATALEIFVVESAGNTHLYVEENAFDGSTVAAQGNTVDIELAGVTGKTVALDAHGYLTVA